jgi:hypothetical protein
MTKDHILREMRKLIDILRARGNILVPTIEGQKETTAQERLVWIIERAKADYGMTIEDIEVGIVALDT